MQRIALKLESLKIAAMRGSKPFPRSRTEKYGVQGNGAADKAVHDFQMFPKKSLKK